MNFPKPKSQDAQIMSSRAHLEIVWRDVLTETQRTLWREYLATHKPHDITGRTFTASTPTEEHETQVSEATLYAWAQIWGVLRFWRSPVLEPTAQPELLLDITATSRADSQLTLSIAFDNAPTVPQMVHTYATAPNLNPGVNAIWRLRDCKTYENVPQFATLNITDWYTHRWSTPPVGRIYVRAARVDGNNMLAELSPIVETLPP